MKLRLKAHVRSADCPDCGSPHNGHATSTKLTPEFKQEIEKFFSHYEVAKLSNEDIAVLFNEEYSDRYTEEDCETQIFDADIQRATEWVKTGIWPTAEWQWWR